MTPYVSENGLMMAAFYSRKTQLFYTCIYYNQELCVDGLYHYCVPYRHNGGDTPYDHESISNQKCIEKTSKKEPLSHLPGHRS